MNVKSRYINVKKVSLQPATKRCDGIDSSQWLGERVPDKGPETQNALSPSLERVLCKVRFAIF